MTIRRAMLHGPDAPGRLLPVLMAVMVFLATLATAWAAYLYEHDRIDRTVRAASLTLNLPPAETPEADAARLQLVLTRVRELPSVVSAAAVPEARLRSLLEPWLGHSDAWTGLRLPTLVDVQVETGANTDRMALESQLLELYPGTTVDSEAPAGGTGTSAANLAISLAGGLVVILAAISAATTGAAVSAAISVRRESTNLLHQLGARDRKIASPLLQGVSVRVALGVVSGAAAAAALWLALGPTGVEPAGSGPLRPGLSLSHLLLVGAVPVLIGLASILTARWAALRTLRHER